MKGFLKDLEKKKEEIKPSLPDQQLIDFKEIRAFHFDEERAVLKINTKLLAYDPKRVPVLIRFVNEIFEKTELESITSIGELCKSLGDKAKLLEFEIDNLRTKLDSSRRSEIYLTLRQKENLGHEWIKKGVMRDKILRCLAIINSIKEVELKIIKRPVTIHRLKSIPLEPPKIGEVPAEEYGD